MLIKHRATVMRGKHGASAMRIKHRATAMSDKHSTIVMRIKCRATVMRGKHGASTMRIKHRATQCATGTAQRNARQAPRNRYAYQVPRKRKKAPGQNKGIQLP